ncbi:MAG TPA: XRE family transcriptional regulator, partial [Longimicrobium sp.]|nr:XRE family transcriptional regulator [Longimicrobium sp.]
NVSRLERRDDMHVSTLREVVEALGGELEITARFPDGQAVRIDRPGGRSRRVRPDAAEDQPEA